LDKTTENTIYLDFHCHSIKPRNDLFVIRSLFLHEENDFAQDKNLNYTIGLHPWYADLLKPVQIITKLQDHIDNKRIIAVGEAGLDKIKGVDWDIQLQALKTQIELSIETEMPLIIHSVRTHNEIIKLRKDYKPAKPWVCHLFSGSEQIAFDFIEHGFYLSIGHHLLDKKSRITEYFHKLPIDKIFLETDDFDVSIEEIYQKASEKLGVSLSFLKKQMFENLNSFVHG
jgi:TatD DNase family protein